MSTSTCPLCGSPRFFGATGYATTQCSCPVTGTYQPIINNYQIDNSLWDKIKGSPVIDPAYRGSLDEMNEQGVADITAFLEMLK